MLRLLLFQVVALPLLLLEVLSLNHDLPEGLLHVGRHERAVHKVLHEPCRASRLEGVATCEALDPLLLLALRADGLVELKDVLALDVDTGLAELQLLGQEDLVRALRPNALPLARQHESRYRTACHGHVSLYVTANKPAGGKNKTQ